jgi:uncharacterized protein YndB with AHSA1/START domain
MTSADVPFDPGPPQQVSTSSSAGGWTLTFTQHLAHPVGTVWSALTSPAELPEWAPYTSDRSLDYTGPATLMMVDGDQRIELDGEVLLARAESVLEHRWGDELLRWELLPAGDAGTQLTLHHTVSQPDQLSMVAAGWHLCFIVADRYLAGFPIGPIVGPSAMNYGWEDLRDRYRELLETT